MTRLARVVALLALLAALVEAAPLGNREIRALEQKIEKAAAAGAWEDVAAAVEQLGEANRKGAFEFMLRAAEASPKTSSVPAALGRAAAHMDDRRVREAVRVAAVRSPHAEVRRQLVLSLATLQEWDPLVAAIRDPVEDVAAIAAWRLVDARVERAVEPLIAEMERLDPTHGGIWDVLRNGLGRLLGVRLESGVEYRARWRLVQEQGGLANVTPAPAPAPAPGGGGGGTQLRFFGSEIDSTRVVLILDVSGSMNAVDRPQGTQTHGGGPQGPMRLDVAKRELTQLIERLPEYFQVNIIAYDHLVRMWRPGTAEAAPTLHALTPPNRQEALAFVAGFQPGGATATHMALEAAYRIEGARAFYLLSDGAPYYNNAHVPPETVLAVIETHGRDRRLPIHTMGFPGVPRDLMQTIADRTGGTYRDIQ